MIRIHTLGYASLHMRLKRRTHTLSDFRIRNRDGRVVFSTREQQHFFNCPYQLAIVPPKLIKRGAIMDRPADADIVEMNVESDDLVLLATDGMFDNLHDKVWFRPFFVSCARAHLGSARPSNEGDVSFFKYIAPFSFVLAFTCEAHVS